MRKPRKSVAFTEEKLVVNTDGTVEIMATPNEEKDTALVSICPKSTANVLLAAQRVPLLTPYYSLTVRLPSHSRRPSLRLMPPQLPLPPRPRSRPPRPTMMASTSP